VRWSVKEAGGCTLAEVKCFERGRLAYMKEGRGGHGTGIVCGYH